MSHNQTTAFGELQAGGGQLKIPYGAAGAFDTNKGWQLRFDDVLGTVRNIDLTAPAAASAAWRQIVDLVGRGRAPADEWAVSTLTSIRDRVPPETRAASARALFGATPPAALVTLLATDDIAVGAPVLRGAMLTDEEWCGLLPLLGPAARAVLRHRRDLSTAVVRALESFGAVDFVIGTERVADAADDADQAPAAPAAPIVPVAEAVPVVAPDPGPFVSVGSIALGLPVVAEALRRENDNEAPQPVEGTYRIADVVARLEAFQKQQADDRSAAPVAVVPPSEVDGFRFETDATGAMRCIDGVARGALIGLSIATAARPGGAGVDAAAAGAFLRRSRIQHANLLVAGSGPASGRWLVSGEPVFDPPTGRFTGYRGSARRPMRHEATAGAPRADALRQLVHELRTPTNAIAGFSEMIEHQMLGPVADAYRDEAATMRTDAGRLLAAIDDLDAAARIDVGALPLRAEPIALDAVLARAVEDVRGLATQRGVELVAMGTAATLADARGLERVVTRLLGTMVGAAASGETIEARATLGAEGTPTLSVTRPRALDAYPGKQALTIDDEDSPATLLGLGFALRLVRNLTRALGGSVDFGRQHIVLSLPSPQGQPIDGVRAS